MTILYFADTRFPIERANGLQTMATCHALASRGHHVTLVVRPDSAVPARDPLAFYGLPAVATLAIERVAGRSAGPARRAQFLLNAARQALRGSSDVIVTRDLGVAAFLLQLPARRRPHVVYESHGISAVVAAEMPGLLGQPSLQPSSHKMRRLDRRERRVWQHAHAYVTITRALADELAAQYGPRERVFVIPDAARSVESPEPRNPRTSEPRNPGTPPFDYAHGVPSDSRGTEPRNPAIAGYAGHLYPWKGVDVLLEALALAPEIRGLIVGGHPGEADLSRVKAAIARLGLESRVTITGLVPPAEVAQRLAPATMLVLPNATSAISERYTSPLKLFEYLGLGRPIVASNLPSIREVLTDEQTALLVEAGNPRALAAAMTRLAGDAELSSRLGHAARELAPAYTWERRAERLEAALAAAAAA